MKFQKILGYEDKLSIILELYLLGKANIIQDLKMQGINKTFVDLLFCFIIGLLIIQASNSIQKQEESSNSINIEDAMITTDSQK